MAFPIQAPPDLTAVDLTRYDKDGVPFEVREYRQGDLEMLEHFYLEFDPKAGAQGLPPANELRMRRWLRSVLDGGIHLLAFRDGELIGHAMVMPTDREGIGEYAVFLRQDVRGRGAGTELNRTVVEVARAAGLTGMWLTVEPSNRPAIRSYEKAGFDFVPGTTYLIEAEMEMAL